jgi:hypothetical protein
VARDAKGMRPASCDSVQAALGCVDALRDSVPVLGPQELLDAICGIEVLTRKTHAVMLELIAGLDAAGVAAEQGFGNTRRLLAAVLDCSAGHARARVHEAHQLANRRTLTGEVLPPLLPATAAALATGQIGAGALQVITQTMAQLPSMLSQHDRDQVEATLAEQARSFDPRRLSVIARRVLDQLDPDGRPPPEPSDPCPAAGELRIRDRRDGGISLEGWLDTLHGTAFRALIDQLAAPRPLSESIPDPRTAEQRNADALVELCDLARGNEQMSAAGGEPLDVGRARRTVPLGIRRALVARDGGCSFPGCDRPPALCHVHHVREWHQLGHTQVNNCILLCGQHHRWVHSTGWDITIRGNLVEFRPPVILDPDRKPLTNPLRR